MISIETKFQMGSWLPEHHNSRDLTLLPIFSLRSVADEAEMQSQFGLMCLN